MARDREPNPGLKQALGDSIDPVKILELRVSELEKRLSRIRSLEETNNGLRYHNERLRNKIREKEKSLELIRAIVSDEENVHG